MSFWDTKITVMFDPAAISLLREILKRKKKKRNKVRVAFMIGPITEQRGPVVRTPNFYRRFSGGRLLMGIELGATKETSFVPKFTDRKGNPATVDGAPSWSTDNSELLALTPSEDGLSCKVAAVGPLGSATVTMHADADKSADVKDIMAFAEITVTAGDATVVELVQGEVVEQAV